MIELNLHERVCLDIVCISIKLINKTQETRANELVLIEIAADKIMKY